MRSTRLPAAPRPRRAITLGSAAGPVSGDATTAAANGRTGRLFGRGAVRGSPEAARSRPAAARRGSAGARGGRAVRGPPRPQPPPKASPRHPRAAHPLTPCAPPPEQAGRETFGGRKKKKKFSSPFTPLAFSLLFLYSPPSPTVSLSPPPSDGFLALTAKECGCSGDPSDGPRCSLRAERGAEIR